MKKAALLLLISTVVLSGCGSTSVPGAAPEATKDTAKGIELTPEAEKIAGVKTLAAGYESVQDGLDVPGLVTSTTKGHAIVTPPVAGRVVSIQVALGEKVTQGQTLAVIESSELAQAWAAIAEATKSRDAAVAEVNQSVSESELASSKKSAATTNLARQRELSKAGAFSQAPLQAAKSELAEAQSDLLAIQKELSTHTELLRRNENLFKEGLVAKADLDESRLEVQKDQINVEREKSRVDAAKATFERESSISQKGLLNAKEIQTAEAELRAAGIELQTSQIKVRSARAAKENAEKAIASARATYRTLSGGGSGSAGRVTLSAPISGKVTKLEMSRGQAVERTQALLEVENLNSVWVTANVPEKDAASVTKGAVATVTVAALPSREFRGVVQVVGSRIDSKTRSIPVQCLIEASDGALVPDMFATVHLGVGGARRGIVVPLSAIVTEDRKSFVFVKVAGKFDKREVELGARSGPNIAVKSGVNEGDQVAVEGAFVLKSESKKDELQGDE